MRSDRMNRITMEPGKCGGHPCIRVMRFRVTDVLDLLASEMTFDEILQDYPYLELEDILAAIEYATRVTDERAVVSS